MKRKKKTQLGLRRKTQSVTVPTLSDSKKPTKRDRERAAKCVIREAVLEKRFETHQAAHKERETALREREESLNVRAKELQRKEREVNRKKREVEREREKDQFEQTKKDRIAGKTKKKLAGENSLLRRKIAPTTSLLQNELYYHPFSPGQRFL